MDKEFPKRKKNRLENYDYSTCGAYFITVCTDKRKRILSRIVGVDVLGDPKNVKLLPHGMVADKYIKQMNEFYENLDVDQYVIMPNHIHLILFVRKDYKANLICITFCIDVQKILQQRIRCEHMATRISRSRYQGKRRL